MKAIFKVLAILGFVALLCIAALALVILDLTTGHVVLENGAGEEISVCSLELPGTTSRFENIKPGCTRDVWFSAKQDGEYHVAVTFSSGSKLVDDVGYVTPNLGNRDRLIISHEQIKLVRDRFPALANSFQAFK
ncbi:MAG: hypothetical protein K2Y39_06415 [Candidatus Obscuribacterales bacterium]|nr:hypothetical protein [Candidatus Obscuribacterales bacterium]